MWGYFCYYSYQNLMIIVPVIAIFLLWLLFVVNPIVMGQIIHTKQQKVRFLCQILGNNKFLHVPI